MSFGAPKPSSHAGLRARAFAWGTARFDHTLEQAYGSLKDALFQDLQGDVLEIGPGTGLNFSHYPRGLRLSAVEPNPHMERHLRAAAEKARIALELHSGCAEALPLPDASADAVVSTLVLCSVSDLTRALCEVRRVLRPGGRFLFIEHVAAPPGERLRLAQDLLSPAWRFFGGGCHPNRETGKFLAEAGFEALDWKERRLDHFPIVAPHIIGTAVR